MLLCIVGMRTRCFAIRQVVGMLAVLAGASLNAGAQSPPGPSPSALESHPDGWIDPLANAGNDLEGWTRLSIPPGGKIEQPSPWSIDPATGVLVCAGETSGHEWLRWDRPLDDAIVHVEWRFVPVEGDNPRYNSGVFVRNSADGAIWHQAQTGGGRGGYLFGDSPVQGERQRVNLSKEVEDGRVKPAGEWNTYEITCRGDQITLWVNGANTCTWSHCEATDGYFGLEAEGYRIEFRNVKVKPL